MTRRQRIKARTKASRALRIRGQERLTGLPVALLPMSLRNVTGNYPWNITRTEEGMKKPLKRSISFIKYIKKPLKRIPMNLFIQTGVMPGSVIASCRLDGRYLNEAAVLRIRPDGLLIVLLLNRPDGPAVVWNHSQILIIGSFTLKQCLFKGSVELVGAVGSG